jgi:chaperonin GroES
MSETLKPLFDRILVKPDPIETQTDSGIIIPDSGQKKPLRGSVVSCGHKVDCVTPGDRVTYGEFHGNKISVNGEEYLLLREAELFAIIEN